MASYLGMFLEQQGFEVKRAQTLGEGRAFLVDRFDLILLDVMLPDGTGDELLPHLREKAPDTPVLMVSGVDGEDERLLKCLKNGAIGWVSKSSRIDELLNHIRRALRE